MEHINSQRSIIHDFFHIRFHETRLVVIIYLYTMLIGMSQVFITVVSFSLFLMDTKASHLPYVYISSAIATLLMGRVYSYFEKKLRLMPLLSNILIISAGSVLLFWVLFLTSNFKWLSAALIVWSFVIFDFGNLNITCLINVMFTLEQGKRLYGVIGSAKNLGGILAGLLSIIMVRMIGNVNILLIIAVLLILTTLVLPMVNKHQKKNLMYQDESLSEKKFELSDKKEFVKKVKNRYLILLFSFIVLITSSYYILDLLFCVVTQEKYPDELELTSFFGIFFALIDMASLLTSLFVFRWLLKYGGVVVSVLLLPLIVGIFSVLLLFTHSFLPAMVELFFLILCLTKLIDGVLRQGIVEQSFLFFFQPLKPILRTWAQARIEMVFHPSATVLVSIVLILIEANLGKQINLLIILSIIIAMCCLMLIKSIKDRYITSLKEALKKHNLYQLNFTLIDKSAINILKTYVKSHKETKAIYALSMLEKMNKDVFFEELFIGLDHPSDKVVKFVLEKIEFYKIKVPVEKLMDLIKKYQGNPLQITCFTALASTSLNESRHLFSSSLESKDSYVRSGAMIGLLKHERKENRNLAKHHLSELVASSDVENRLIAAEIIHLVGKVYLSNQLIRLLNDHDIDVKAAACLAAGKIKSKKIFLFMMEKLKNNTVLSCYYNCLAMYGRKIIPLIENKFSSYDANVQYHLSRICKHIHSSKINKILKKELEHASLRVRHGILDALISNHYKAESVQSRKIILELLEKEHFYHGNINEITNSLPIIKETKLLLFFLARELQLSRERIFMLLNFLYPANTLLIAMKGLNSNDAVLKSYGAELILYTLSSQDQKKYLSVLLSMSQHKVYISSQDNANLIKTLKNIFDLCSIFYLKEIKSIFIYIVVSMKLDELYRFIPLLQSQGDSVLNETLNWAFGENRPSLN